MNQRTPLAVQRTDHIREMDLQKDLLQSQCAYGQHSDNADKYEACCKKCEGMVRRSTIQPSALSLL